MTTANTTTPKPAAKPYVRKTVDSPKGAYLENPFWKAMEELKAQSFLGRLVVVKTDKMPHPRVGLITDTDYQKGRNVGNTYLTITFNDGCAITIDWRQGGYSLRLAKGADFVGMFPQEDDVSEAAETPSVEVPSETVESLVAEVAALNEAPTGFDMVDETAMEIEVSPAEGIIEFA